MAQSRRISLPHVHRPLLVDFSSPQLSQHKLLRRSQHCTDGLMSCIAVRYGQISASQTDYAQKYKKLE